MKKQHVIDVLSERTGKYFMPPDNGDNRWIIGAETFTREEVAALLWTQIAAMENDMKIACGKDMTEAMYYLLDNPRIPVY